MSTIPPRRTGVRLKLRMGLVLLFAGLFLFILGSDPALFGLDFSPVVGFVQIAVLLIGLAMVCIGGYTSLNLLWETQEKSITADIGTRLVATGFVLSAASGMADVFGFGSQPFPAIPYFGPWQALGVMTGQVVIILGFILMIRLPKMRRRSPSDEIE